MLPDRYQKKNLLVKAGKYLLSKGSHHVKSILMWISFSLFIPREVFQSRVLGL